MSVLERVRQAIPDVLLVIAGEGPALPALRRDVEARGLAGHVCFVGYLDRSGPLLDCYRSANAFVLNTWMPEPCSPGSLPRMPSITHRSIRAPFASRR